MRPQARPFAVEIKAKRKPSNGSHQTTGWAALSDIGIDELPQDDVPARDVHADLEPPFGREAALEAANRLFRTLPTTASPTVPVAPDLATEVFGSAAPVSAAATEIAPSDQAGEALVRSEPEVRREPRVLPSLVPSNPWERQEASSPARAVARKPKQTRPRTKPDRAEVAHMRPEPVRASCPGSRHTSDSVRDRRYARCEWITPQVRGADPATGAALEAAAAKGVLVADSPAIQHLPERTSREHRLLQFGDFLGIFAPNSAKIPKLRRYRSRSVPNLNHSTYAVSY